MGSGMLAWVPAIDEAMVDHPGFLKILFDF